MISKTVSLVLGFSILGSVAGAAPLIYGTAYSDPHSASTLYSLSATTGAATSVGAIGFSQVDALAFAPNGNLYGIGQNGADKWVLLKIDLLTGAGTAVGPTGLDSSFRDIAFRSDGTLFGYMRSSTQKSRTGTVYSIDTNTGKGRFAGNVTGALDDASPVAFSSESVLYAVNQHSLGTVAASSAGLLTALHYSPALASAQPAASAVEYDSNAGKLWALVGTTGGSGGNYLATIDVKTGNVAAVGKTAASLHALAIEPKDIVGPPPPSPLPSSILFLISGILALFGWNMWTRSRFRSVPPSQL